MNNMINYSQKTKSSFAEFLQLYSTTQLLNIANHTKTISSTVTDISNSLERAVIGIESIGDTLSYGMMAQITLLEAQNKILSSQLTQLESIDNALRNPDAVRAKEWILKGEDFLAKGLLDLALNAFLKSNEIFTSNFLIHLHIGKLFLFGVNEECNVINIDNAIEHLTLASRLAKSEVKLDDKIKSICAESYYYLSVSHYIKGNELYIKNKTTEEFDSYNLALKAATISLQFAPMFYEARYHLCKYLSILSKNDTAMHEITSLINQNPELYKRLITDEDFDNVLVFIQSIDIDSIMESYSKIKEAVSISYSVGATVREKIRKSYVPKARPGTKSFQRILFVWEPRPNDPNLCFRVIQKSGRLNFIKATGLVEDEALTLKGIDGNTGKEIEILESDIESIECLYDPLFGYKSNDEEELYSIYYQIISEIASNANCIIRFITESVKKTCELLVEPKCFEFEKSSGLSLTGISVVDKRAFSINLGLITEVKSTSTL